MPLKVAKIYFFSYFREISSTKQMKYAMVLLYYEYIAIYLWKYAKNKMIISSGNGKPFLRKISFAKSFHA